jgi:hypothetical protein
MRSVLLIGLRHGATSPAPALRPDPGPLPDRPGRLSRHQPGAGLGPAHPVLRLQGEQAGVPVLAVRHQDPPEHDDLSMDGRPRLGLRQRGAGPGPSRFRRLRGQLHEDVG